MSPAAPTIPACPITGKPAIRLIQTVSSDLLIGLWKASFGVAAADQLGRGRSFGLWESPCGLVFFDPMVEGDTAFYRGLYDGWGKDGPWSEGTSARADYARAAAEIKPYDRVLDVGCGAGAFAAYIPHATYVGLDDNYPAAGSALDIRNERLAAHCAAHADHYDVVCAFHVIEHVADPARFIANMRRCLRPGGLLILAMPKFRSAINDIPNFVFNAPPHHLSWWNERALQALAQGAGLEVESISGLPLSAPHRLGHWMGRIAPKLTGDHYFRHSTAWHAALLWSFLAGRLCSMLCGTPTNAPPLELLLVARKPSATAP